MFECISFNCDYCTVCLSDWHNSRQAIHVSPHLPWRMKRKWRLFCLVIVCLTGHFNEHSTPKNDVLIQINNRIKTIIIFYAWILCMNVTTYNFHIIRTSVFYLAPVFELHNLWIKLLNINCLADNALLFRDVNFHFSFHSEFILSKFEMQIH